MSLSPAAKKRIKIGLIALRVVGIYGGIKAAQERTEREKRVAAQVAEIRELAWVIAQGQRVRSRPAASKADGPVRISTSSARRPAAPQGTPPGPPNPPRPPHDHPVG